MLFWPTGFCRLRNVAFWCQYAMWNDWMNKPPFLHSLTACVENSGSCFHILRLRSQCSAGNFIFMFSRSCCVNPPWYFTSVSNMMFLEPKTIFCFIFKHCTWSAPLQTSCLESLFEVHLPTAAHMIYSDCGFSLPLLLLVFPYLLSCLE